MWVDSGIHRRLTLVRKDMFNRPECEHDESEYSAGEVEAVAPVDDEPHPPVEAFVAGIVDPEFHGRQDRLFAFADGLGQGDEALESAALCLRTESVEEHADLVVGEVAGEDQLAVPPSVDRPATGRLLVASVCAVWPPGRRPSCRGS